jgi:prepilin-type N-terminal cleavage/methylation domain-containing protein
VIGTGRRAFTLLEVMLTLGLLVIVAALAWPAFEKPFAGMRLRKAADQVRAEWATARVEAINSGQPYLFHYAIGEGRFCTECYSPGAAQEGSTLGTGLLPTGQVSTGIGAGGAAGERSLPEGVTFAAGETAPDTRAAMIAAEMQQSGMAETGSSDPILFYPDGTTSTARLVLKNEYDRYIELQLRGLTGVVSVGEVRTAQEALP